MPVFRYINSKTVISSFLQIYLKIKICTVHVKAAHDDESYFFFTIAKIFIQFNFIVLSQFMYNLHNV